MCVLLLLKCVVFLVRFVFSAQNCFCFVQLVFLFRFDVCSLCFRFVCFGLCVHILFVQMFCCSDLFFCCSDLIVLFVQMRCLFRLCFCSDVFLLFRLFCSNFMLSRFVFSVVHICFFFRMVFSVQNCVFAHIAFLFAQIGYCVLFRPCFSSFYNSDLFFCCSDVFQFFYVQSCFIFVHIVLLFRFVHVVQNCFFFCSDLCLCSDFFSVQICFFVQIVCFQNCFFCSVFFQIFVVQIWLLLFRCAYLFRSYSFSFFFV